MGDRLATVDMSRKLGRKAELRSHLAECGPGRGLPARQVES